MVAPHFPADPAAPELWLDCLRERLRFDVRSRAAAAAVLVAITDEVQPRVLLTRRSMQLSQHAGEVSFPGGKRDPADTSNIVVALREAHEEVGLDPFAVRLLGSLPAQRARSGLWVRPIVGLIDPQVSLTAQPDEIDRIFFMPLSALQQAQPQPHTIRFGVQWVDMPSYQFDNEIIWGLTARILVSLLNRGLGWSVQWPWIMAARPILERS